jgi:hypothetical protein
VGTLQEIKEEVYIKKPDGFVIHDVGVGSHSWIATRAEPNVHQFMSRINLMDDQMGRDPGRYHSNLGTMPGM